MKTVQEMITLRELISNICDDLQHYLNDTPVMDVEVDVVIRLLRLMEMYKEQYIDSVGCVHAPDSDGAEDKDAADALDDFDIGEIQKTMNQPIDHNTRKPFTPTLGGIYRLAGTRSMYQCIDIDATHQTCTMRDIEPPNWTCDVHDVGIYNNYSIDWARSTGWTLNKE